MEEAQLVQIAASLLGGGAVGALITALVTTYKARVLPIGRRIEMSPLFTSEFGGTNFRTSVTVSDGMKDIQFPNLHLAELQLVNRGNKDLASFSFGVTLTGLDKVVHVEPQAKDRHHIALLKNPCSPATPTSTLDFELKPLNRGDTYTFRLFIVAGSDHPEPIIVGSSEAVRFADMPSVAETLAVAASTLSLKVGLFEIRVPR